MVHIRVTLRKLDLNTVQYNTCVIYPHFMSYAVLKACCKYQFELQRHQCISDTLMT